MLVTVTIPEPWFVQRNSILYLDEFFLKKYELDPKPSHFACILALQSSATHSCAAARAVPFMSLLQMLHSYLMVPPPDAEGPGLDSISPLRSSRLLVRWLTLWM